MPGKTREYNGKNNSQSPAEAETFDRGIFGGKLNLEARFIADHADLKEQVEAMKKLGLSIVMTSGSFDMVHVGHARYLDEAKKCGDILIVGLDSDAKVKKRKGENRPVVPEDERTEMLAHLRSVDIITHKQPDEPKWGLIRLVEPDTLIVTERIYDDEGTLKELAQICGRLIVLEPQATTSTSAKIRRMQVGWVDQIIEPVSELLQSAHVDTATIVAVEALLKDSQK